MNEPEAPTIEFPCDYPIKVIGDYTEDIGHEVTRVVQQFDAGFDPASITARPSRNSRFISLRVTFRAASEDQLKAVFNALKATGRVHMVV